MSEENSKNNKDKKIYDDLLACFQEELKRNLEKAKKKWRVTFHDGSEINEGMQGKRWVRVNTFEELSSPILKVINELEEKGYYLKITSLKDLNNFLINDYDCEEYSVAICRGWGRWMSFYFREVINQKKRETPKELYKCKKCMQARSE